jgi:hypothetical protein
MASAGRQALILVANEVDYNHRSASGGDLCGWMAIEREMALVITGHLKNKGSPVEWPELSADRSQK